MLEYSIVISELARSSWMNLPVRLTFMHIILAASCVIRCRDPRVDSLYDATACRLILEHVVREFRIMQR
jgi:hypothetical protein